MILCMVCCVMQVGAQDKSNSLKKGIGNFFKLIQQDAHPTGIHDPWDLYVGPRLGLDVATLTSTGGTPTIGITGGGFFEIFILKNLSIEMGINYTHQGVNNVSYTKTTTLEDGSQEQHSTDHDYSLHYINTDYLCRWYPKAELPLSVYTGLHLARIIKAIGKSTEKTNIRDHLHRGDIAFPVGVSYEWGQWQADVRYLQSVRHIGRTATAKRNLDNANNCVLELTVAYKILLW